MKQLALILGLTVLLTSCDFFENNEKKAIEICKKAKVQFGTTDVWSYLGLSMAGLTPDATWLDYANILAKEDPNTKLSWSAKETDEKQVYLVALTDESGWGHGWEVSLGQQIVKSVNANEYLSRKYGLSRLDEDEKFKITDITIDTLTLERKYPHSKDKTMDIVYVIKGSVINNTDKTLIKADISGELQLIFKDKTVESSEDYNSGFKVKISKSNPWRPKEKLDFYIKAKSIDEIYLQYIPEYVFFNVNISAEDPIGFSYNRIIKEYDLKDKWESLKQ